MKPATITLTDWDGDLPMPGHYIASHKGKIAYLILEVRRPKRPCKYVAKLICERRGRADLLQREVIYHWMRWNKR